MCCPTRDENPRRTVIQGTQSNIADIEYSLPPWILLVLLLVMLVALGCLLPGPLRPSFIFTAAVSVTSYLVTVWLVPVLGQRLSGCGKNPEDHDLEPP